MTNIETLIERLEKADGPDRCSRSIDGMIASAIGLTMPIDSVIPAYTSSIDDALTLVPEGRMWMAGRAPARYWAQVSGPRRSDEFLGENKIEPAIALCIAALKARAARGR